MSADRVIKTMARGKPKDKRSRGRPRRSWREAIMANLNKRKFTAGEVKLGIEKNGRK